MKTRKVRIGRYWLGLATLVASAACGQSQSPERAVPWKTGSYFPPSPQIWPTEEITPLLRAVSPDRLRIWHDLLASEPHVAGTPGDERQVNRIMKVFTDLGLEVEKHEVWVYLSTPKSAVLEIVEGSPGSSSASTTTKVSQRRALVVKETILPEDIDSANPDLTWGWNAYSGSGDVTAEVVYANQGTRADFAKLRELGIDLRGKIVLCRYGGNFRGYKAKYAQQAGAIGLVVFTDGGDGKLAAYPTGGAPNDSCIERGSINALDYPGDPLTPGIEATKDAARLDMHTVGLPSIPVQPIGWGAAREILIRMAAADETAQQDGQNERPALPEGWQSKIAIPHQLSSGPRMKLRLKVEQTREVTKTWNVIGTLRGKVRPDQWVLVGSHHDAWGFGACDPAAGTICTLESARVFAEAAQGGRSPDRTLKFCCWGAEEFGIIGSTEWVEARRDELTKRGIAYINLDMSAMGHTFGSSAAPALKGVITQVAHHVPASGAALDERGNLTGPSVFDTWIAREPDPRLPGHPKFGDLGGGSDHVAFWCHAGVPSAAMGSGGTPGSAYHSVYDTLRWYRQNVGDDYEPARMVTQMVVGTVARLSESHEFLCEPGRSQHDAAGRLRELAGKNGDVIGPETIASLNELAVKYDELARRLGSQWIQARSLLKPPATQSDGTDRVPAQLLATCNQWLSAKSLSGRPWYRNDFAAPDATSGYASWVLPELSGAIEFGDRAGIAAAIAALRQRAAGFEALATEVDTAIQRADLPREPK